MKRKMYAPLAAAAVMSVLLAGCTTGDGIGVSAETASAGKSTDTVRVTLDLPSGFDPTQARSTPDLTAARMSYDTLIRKDSDGELASGLAAEWSVKPTGIEFTIRKDSTCSDGTAITPSVVKESLEYLADPKTGAPYAPRIFGASGDPVFKADDTKGTLAVTLKNPWPDMLNGLSLASAGVICPAGLQDLKALKEGTATGSESGPYLLAKKEHNVRYDFKLRDDYGAWPIYKQEIEGEIPKNVQFAIVSDRNAIANQLLGGQLDIGISNASSAERFRNNEKFTVTSDPFSPFAVMFNQREDSPFADPKLRKAVAQVLDRNAFSQVISNGEAPILTQLATDNIRCTNPDQSPVVALDEAAAAKVLKGVKIRIVGTQIVGPAGAGNVYVQEKLRAAGAEVELENLDIGGWVAKISGDPDAWDMTVDSSLNFAGTMFYTLPRYTGPTIQNGGANIGNAKNSTAEAAIEKFFASQGEDDQCAALQDAMNALVANVDTIPLASDPRRMIAAEGFSVTSNPGALDDQILRITK